MSTENKQHSRDKSPKRDLRPLYYFTIDGVNEESFAEIKEKFVYSSPNFYDGDQLSLKVDYNPKVKSYYIRTVLCEEALKQLFDIWSKHMVKRFPSLTIHNLLKVVEVGTVGHIKK